MEIENFGPYYGKHEIVFNEGPLYILATNHDPGHTSNGGGKSSIGRALGWCLTGTTSTGNTGNSIINYECHECRVVVYFDELIVTRYKRRSKGEVLEFRGTGAASVCEDLRPTQDRLNQILGVDSKLFYNALWMDVAFQTQHLLRKTPSQRLEVMMDLIGGERIQEARKKAGNLYRSIGTRIEVGKERLENARRERVQCETRLCNIKRVEREEEEALHRFRESKDNKIRNIENDIESLSVEIQNLKKEEERLTNTVGVSVQEASSNVAIVVENLGRLKKQRQTILGKAGLSSECPTCQRPFLKKDVFEKKSAVDSISKEISKEETILAREEDRLLSVIGAWKEIDKIRKKCVFFYNEIVAKKKELASVSSSEYNGESRRLDLEQMRIDEEDLLLSKTVLVKTIEKDLDDCEYKRPMVAEWMEAFGSKGIQNLLLDDVRNLVVQFSEQYIKELGGGVLGIDMPCTTAGFEITVSQYGKDVPIENMSGGEVGRNLMAVLLGLRKALLYLNKCNLDFVVLDDILSLLDEDGMSNAIEMANRLSKEIGTVIVTMPYQHESIPPAYILQVEKKNGRAKII